MFRSLPILMLILSSLVISGCANKRIANQEQVEVMHWKKQNHSLATRSVRSQKLKINMTRL